jgi:hypothetical protein
MNLTFAIFLVVVADEDVLHKPVCRPLIVVPRKQVERRSLNETARVVRVAAVYDRGLVLSRKLTDLGQHEVTNRLRPLMNVQIRIKKKHPQPLILERRRVIHHRVLQFFLHFVDQRNVLAVLDERKQQTLKNINLPHRRWRQLVFALVA